MLPVVSNDRVVALPYGDTVRSHPVASNKPRHLLVGQVRASARIQQGSARKHCLRTVVVRRVPIKRALRNQLFRCRWKPHRAESAHRDSARPEAGQLLLTSRAAERPSDPVLLAVAAGTDQPNQNSADSTHASAIVALFGCLVGGTRTETKLHFLSATAWVRGGCRGPRPWTVLYLPSQRDEGRAELRRPVSRPRSTGTHLGHCFADRALKGGSPAG